MAESDAAAVADGAADEADGPADRTEMFAAIILGVAATLTALSAYWSGIAGGNELAAFSTSNAKLTDANFFYERGGQTQAQDGQLFVAYLEDSRSPEPTGFVEDLMRPELLAAVEDWETTEDMLTPFESEAYSVEDFDIADGLQSESEAALAEAETEGAKGDKLDLATVIFAVALFAAGIVLVFQSRKLRGALLVVSALLTVGGGALMASAFA